MNQNQIQIQLQDVNGQPSVISSKQSQKSKLGDCCGLYYVLNVYFYQNTNDIDDNYVRLKEFFSNEDLKKRKPEELKLMSERIEIAYKILQDTNKRKKYLNEIKVRSYLNQLLDTDELVQYPEVKLFPYFIFEVYKEFSANNIIVEYDFVNLEIRETGPKNQVIVYKFSDIDGTVFCMKDDEYVVNIKLGSKTHSFSYRVKYISQRNQIVEITQIAKAVAEENKPFLKFINPIFKDVYNNSLDIFKIPELKSQFKNKFYWNDNIMPAKPLVKIQASLQKRFSSSKIQFLIGITMLIITNDSEGEEILQVVPIKKEYMAFVINRQSMQLYILNKNQKYKFNSEDDALKFNAAIKRSYEMRRSNMAPRTIVPITTEFMMETSYLRPFRNMLILKIKQKIGDMNEKQKKYIRKLEELQRENEHDETLKRIIQEKMGIQNASSDKKGTSNYYSLNEGLSQFQPKQQ